MLKMMLPILLGASLFLTAATPSQAVNSSLQMGSMEIDIWPEYDRPSALIIYRIDFTSVTSFPAMVSFTIPTSAGEPYSVAMKDMDGLLYDLEYSSLPDGNWNHIEFITSTPDIQLEFYDPISQNADGSHSYAFRWMSDYAIDDLKIVIQKPKYATNMKIQPDFGAGAINSDDNLTYFTADVGTVSLAKDFNIGISYFKANDFLSASTLPVRAVNSLPQKLSIWQTLRTLSSAVWQNNNLMTAGALFFAGLFLLLIGMLLTMHKKYQLKAPLGGKEQKPKKTPAENASETIAVYCHACGKRARPGDLYCRACGSKLIRR
jgi:hypothetical protein